MTNEEIIQTINSFDHWIDQFDLKGNLTPVPDKTSPIRTLQRKAYFFDPVVRLFGGSLKGKRILDVGCNAGFWSLQALEAGADSIVGIDGRQVHIDQANFVYKVKDIDPRRYRFVKGNVFDVDFKALGEFDVVLCLGFFHHVSKQMLLLEKIAEVNKDILILETRISRLPGAHMAFVYSSTDHYANALDYSLTMLPTKKAVLGMAGQFGYKTVMLKPQQAHKEALLNYKLNRRKAFICSKKSDLANLPAEVEQITLGSELKDVASMGTNWLMNRLFGRKQGSEKE